MSDEKDTAESPEAKPETRPIHYVLVRHMARSPRTRTLRAARAGHRRQGVLLDDGTRIRKRGKRRLTEVDLRTMVDNHQKLLEYVRVGTIEVLDPVTEQAIPYEGVVEIIENLAKTMKLEKFELLETGVQDEVIPGSDVPENTAPMPDTTRPDIDASAMMAAADQAEAKKRGEANLPPSEEEAEELTEADLKKMNRKELDALATDNGLDPGDYSKKDELIEALLELGEE